MAPRTIPAHEIHGAIRVHIKRRPDLLSTSSWLSRKEPLGSGGRSPAALYSLARSRRVGGKSFFGRGSWGSYLEREHGVVALDPWALPDDRVNRTIAKILSGFREPQWTSKHWQSNRRATNGSRSLKAWHQRVFKIRVGGNSYMSHRTWKAYTDFLRREYDARPAD